MPLRRAHPPNIRKQLLAFAADLLDEEELDLDIVDGEFYWRWCRTDLLTPYTTMPNLARPIGARDTSPRARLRQTEPDLSIEFEPEGFFDYLRDSLRFVEDVLTFSEEVAQRFPRVVWQRLLDGERVSMRGAEVEFVYDGQKSGSPRAVRLRIFSGAWTGAHVEEELRRLTLTRQDPLEPKPEQGSSIGLQMRFDFVGEAQARQLAEDHEHVRAPYVQVEAPVPLPPEGSIAREYEALVRGEQAWHLEMPGGVSRQDVVVAIRTWAIGLLAHDGLSINDAIDTVHLHLGLSAITQSCFGGDRKRLIERVPEAEPHLSYVPPSREQQDTRLVRPHPLVSAVQTAPLTQPGMPDETLFP